MAVNEQLADRVREIIARTHQDVEEKRMFGGLCFMVDGKMCVGVESERLMVRFDPARTGEVMEMDGAGPMDFTKRVMKGFAFVESRVLETRAQLEFWVGLALEFNKLAKPSKKRQKKADR
ncbi:MAG: TfoX/Sxy family protein [Pyrinomonadaceae bacterium]